MTRVALSGLARLWHPQGNGFVVKGMHNRSFRALSGLPPPTSAFRCVGRDNQDPCAGRIDYLLYINIIYWAGFDVG